MTLLRGRVPVTEFDDYAQEVASYTGGRGRLSLEPAGYGPCHNPDAVIAAADYDPEADPDNTPDSVFCAHGGGFTVKWDKVAEYMHLPRLSGKAPGGRAGAPPVHPPGRCGSWRPS